MSRTPGKSTDSGKPAAIVIDERGRESSLGDLIELLVSRSGLPVTRIAEAAGVSRSFFYLLRDDRQIPSLESLVSLLAACQAGEVRLAEAGEPGEIVVMTEGETFYVQLLSTRSRLASSTLRASKPASGAAWDDDVSFMAAPPAWGMATSSPAYADAETPPPSQSRFSLAAEGGRDRWLGELLDVAGGLDAKRLELLVDYARLLRKS